MRMDRFTDVTHRVYTSLLQHRRSSLCDEQLVLMYVFSIRKQYFSNGYSHIIIYNAFRWHPGRNNTVLLFRVARSEHVQTRFYFYFLFFYYYFPHSDSKIKIVPRNINDPAITLTILNHSTNNIHKNDV